MTKVRVFVLLITLIVVGGLGYFASLYARGYRFNNKTYKFQPSGVLVIKSDPDGASIYINGDLRGATNSNLSLSPGTYDVEIKREGFTSWSKRIVIQKEEVTQITANIFRIAPALSPITFDGAQKPVASDDFSKIAYINKDGLWIMQTSILPIGFSNDPRRITDGDLTGAIYQFSPNGQEIMLETVLGTYLLDTESFTGQNERVNIAATKPATLTTWKQQRLVKDTKLINSILPTEVGDFLLKDSKAFKFAPDDTMVMYTASTSAKLSDNLIKQLPGSSTQPQERDIKPGNTYVYDIKEDRNFLIGNEKDFLYWLPTSRHIIKAAEANITIMDYDGTNKQTVFSGGYIAPFAYPYVNSSKLMILTNLGSESAVSNLYSLNIK
jgi:hypothetical protein